MTDHPFREQEVQIAHYRLLSREVTDPLAACLLRVIVEEFEADPRRDRDIGQSCSERGARPGRRCHILPKIGGLN